MIITPPRGGGATPGLPDVIGVNPDGTGMIGDITPGSIDATSGGTGAIHGVNGYFTNLQAGILTGDGGNLNAGYGTTSINSSTIIMSNLPSGPSGTSDNQLYQLAGIVMIAVPA